VEGKDCATILAAGGWSGVLVAQGFTDQASAEFTVDQRLMQGTLKTAVPVTYVESGAEVSVVVDLSWTGIVGQLAPERTHQGSPGTFPGPVIVHSRGYFRPATASGSVSEGATNYAPSSSTFGALFVRSTRTAATKPRLLH
jgi:hypothetical protein